MDVTRFSLPSPLPLLYSLTHTNHASYAYSSSIQFIIQPSIPPSLHYRSISLPLPSSSNLLLYYSYSSSSSSLSDTLFTLLFFITSNTTNIKKCSVPFINYRFTIPWTPPIKVPKINHIQLTTYNSPPSFPFLPRPTTHHPRCHSETSQTQ